jgi:hypothetical protein
MSRPETRLHELFVGGRGQGDSPFLGGFVGRSSPAGRSASEPDVAKGDKAGKLSSVVSANSASLWLLAPQRLPQLQQAARLDLADALAGDAVGLNHLLAESKIWRAVASNLL